MRRDQGPTQTQERRNSYYESGGQEFESLRARHLQFYARARRCIQRRADAPCDAIALFGALAGGRWDVASKVHSVVEDAHDFDRAVRRSPVHQEMASATAAPRNVERAKACHDLVPGPGARYIGAAGKFANRLNKSVPIDARLSRAKILRSPFEDVGKVDFCGCAEANAPSPLGHECSIRRFGR